MKERKIERRARPLFVGIGELLWDVLPTGQTTGGAPINFVYHASQLGAEGYAISAVGNDEAGERILSKLDAHSIHHLIEKVPYPTGTVQVEWQEGVPAYKVGERVAWDHIVPTADAVDLAERADAICFGTLAQRSYQSRETIQSILSFAPDEAYRIFDVNLREHYYSRELIEESLYFANMMQINERELQVMREMFKLKGPDEAVVRWFMEKYGLQMVILFKGVELTSLYTPLEFSKMPIAAGKEGDTLGVGDAFIAALVLALLERRPLKEAHRFAAETASFVRSKVGAWPVYEN